MNHKEAKEILKDVLDLNLDAIPTFYSRGHLLAEAIEIVIDLLEDEENRRTVANSISADESER